MDGTMEPICEVKMYRESALERLPDDQLLREASRGDTDALQVFCVKRLPSLLRYAKYQCQQQGVPIDLADDFCHDGILEAVDFINDCKEHGHRPLPKVTAAWIKKIVANLIRDPFARMPAHTHGGKRSWLVT